MINLNGVEWKNLKGSDIKQLVKEEDTDESFFLEFKSDKVEAKKLAKEISAFANTYGGYIILGVSDKKEIEGCTQWTEQRLHTTIHNELSPIPIFDVKRFKVNNKNIFIIRIDEGPEPPYITRKGQIYQRVSSGSFPINQTSQLHGIVEKHEKYESLLNTKLSIPEIINAPNNLYGYIDIGFSPVFSDSSLFEKTFNDIDINEIVNSDVCVLSPFSIHRIGNNIICNIGSISSDYRGAQANMGNFMSIMTDGSVKMRYLLSSNLNDGIVNISIPIALGIVFENIYNTIVGTLIPDHFVYAKKYEKLTVLKQFTPTLSLEKEVFGVADELALQNEKYQKALAQAKEKRGEITVITNGRFPYSGYRIIDKRLLEWHKLDFSKKNIINTLFGSTFVFMGIQDDILTLSHDKNGDYCQE